MMFEAAARLTWEKRFTGVNVRWHLFANDDETPIFIEVASAVERELWNKPVALCGRGLCPYVGCTATLGGFCRIDAAKRHAEKLWREWTVSGELKRRIEAGELAARTFYGRNGRRLDGSPMQEVA